MRIKSKQGWEIPESDATSEASFHARRRLVKALGIGTVAGMAGAYGLHQATKAKLAETEEIEFGSHPKEFRDAGREITSSDKVFRFTNFYEFAIDKTSSARLCKNFRIDPYLLKIQGLVNKPIQLDIDQIRKLQLEQRTYRFRCVEAWAMTVPWIGVPLSTLLKLADPKSQARYVSMTSFHDPQQARRQTGHYFPWPYREAITIEEAMNPLAFAVIGMYGKTLQPQNGAPFRIILPWKYGFKGAKSVVSISLTDRRPATFWNTLQPQEYGFTGNVNPDQPHPRWSQKREALIGTWGKRVPTQLYNGYGPWVGDLYSGQAVSG